MILADCPELKKIHWSCVIIDEAHRLKNRNCKLLEGLKLMALVRIARSLYEQRLLLFTVEEACFSHSVGSLLVHSLFTLDFVFALHS